MIEDVPIDKRLTDCTAIRMPPAHPTVTPSPSTVECLVFSVVAVLLCHNALQATLAKKEHNVIL